uniref:Uncharacterized protein n=1 Tax=Ciona savignyi TaxID=51511 RepID=H2YVW0_CIOSA
MVFHVSNESKAPDKEGISQNFEKGSDAEMFPVAIYEEAKSPSAPPYFEPKTTTRRKSGCCGSVVLVAGVLILLGLVVFTGFSWYHFAKYNKQLKKMRCGTQLIDFGGIVDLMIQPNDDIDIDVPILPNDDSTTTTLPMDTAISPIQLPLIGPGGSEILRERFIQELSSKLSACVRPGFDGKFIDPQCLKRQVLDTAKIIGETFYIN